MVFPRICLARRNEGQPYVSQAWTDADDRVIAVVSHGVAHVAGEWEPADVYYTLGRDLAPERVELSREFMLVHTELQREGKVNHPFGPAEEKDFFPLLRWDGDHFTALPVAEVKY